jgi:hypothetical protein
MHSIKKINVACCLATILVFSLPACAKKESDVTHPPIRILRTVNGKISGMKQFLEISWGACHASKGNVNPPPISLPSDAVLSKINLIEEENLFDQDMYAFYITQSIIYSDPKNNCQLTIYKKRTVEVSKSCGYMVSASGDNINVITGEKKSGPSGLKEASMSETPACLDGKIKEKREKRNEKIPSEHTSLGVKCFWSGQDLEQDVSELLKMVGKTEKIKSEPDPDQFDTCLYEKMPTYLYKDSSKPIILKTKGNLVNKYGQDISMATSGLHLQQDLKEFSDGTPISPDRFSRATIEAFSRLPSKEALSIK